MRCPTMPHLGPRASQAPRRSTIALGTIWISALAAIAWTGPHPGIAHAYTPTEFVIGVTGSTGEEAPRPFFLGSTASPLDSTQMGMVYRTLAGCYINQMMTFTMTNAEAPICLQAAADNHLKIIVSRALSSPPDLVPMTGLSTAQQNAFLGYRVCDNNDGPTTNPTAADKTAVSAIHSAQPDKIVYVNQIHTGVIANWMTATAAERPDVWSGEGYVHNGFDPGSQLRDDLKLSSAPDPFWSFGYVEGQDYDYPSPTDESMRAMAFQPVAYGARGIVWSDWEVTAPWQELRAGVGQTGGEVGGTIGGSIATRQYWRLRTINHYLHDVVGPAVMRCTHLWTLHHQEGNTDTPIVPDTPDDRFIPTASKPLFHSPADIPGAQTMVSIWQPTNVTTSDPSGTYYLLVANRLLTSTSDVLTLHGDSDYDVGVAPSVIGYLGGSYFSAVTVSHPAGSDHQTQFSISLAGGEGRLYKVVPKPTGTDPADIAGITTVLGGASWSEGQSKTIALDRSLTGIQVRLYTSRPSCESSGGPYVALTPSVTSGTSFSITVPSVSTRRGWIEVTGNTANGSLVHLTHQAPLRVSITNAVGPDQNSTTATYGHAYASQAANSSGNPSIFLTTSLSNPRGALWVPSSGSGPADIPDQQNLTNTGSEFGLSPSVAVDGAGNTQAAYYTLFEQAGVGSGRQLLHYGIKSGTTWSFEDIDVLYWRSNPQCALTLNASNQAFVAYSAGSLSGYVTKVKHRYGPSAWEPYDVFTQEPRAHSYALTTSPAGGLWMSCITDATNELLVQSQSGSPTFFNAGTCLLGTMHLAPDGVPEVVYSKADAGTGGETLYFQRIAWNASTGTWGLPPEVIDASVKTIDGIALSNYGSLTEVAYICNGTVKIATHQGTNAWNRFEDSDTHTASGQLGYTTDAAGDRWVSYWDQPADQMVVSLYAAPPVGGGGDDGGGGEILPHAITFQSENPVAVGDELRLRFSLTRSARVHLQLFDITGRVAAERPEAVERAGESNLHWRPAGIRAGVYFLRMAVAGSNRFEKRVVFVK